MGLEQGCAVARNLLSTHTDIISYSAKFDLLSLAVNYSAKEPASEKRHQALRKFDVDKNSSNGGSADYWVNRANLWVERKVMRDPTQVVGKRIKLRLAHHETIT